MAIDVRQEMHKLMTETLADEQKFHDWWYHEVRPMYVPPHWSAGQRIQGDCSKGCQYLARWAFGPDPMGVNFGPWGNSSYICHHLQHLDSPKHLKVADFVTFGIAGSLHAACVMEEDPVNGDPLLWSFGHQGAPDAYHLSQDHRPSQWLRNPVPIFIPTPQDKLRLMRGYFAWVAWRLGEGDWSGYGVANAKVRPNVPKLISPVWWKHYGLFLANRQRGNKATK